MDANLFNSLLECRTLEETLKLASLYTIAKYLESEYHSANAAGSDNATELHIKWTKARLNYMYAVQGVSY